MRFTSDELMFLTAITKGPAPFGVFFDKVRKKDAASKAQNAKDELINKGILTADSITPKGIAVIKVWEEYRNADRFIVIKNNIIGLLDNRRCVVIYRDEAGFEITSGDRAEILYGCLKKYPFLRRADKKYKEIQINENLDYESFRVKVQKFDNNVMTFGLFLGNGCCGEERFFYWNEEEIFSYNPHTLVEKIEEPSSVRKFILDSLEINMEVLTNGRQ